ncbi:hypothetical protein HRI97_08930 [Treponema socranskii subsp. buccale]|uniref:hypothetical protein n=1 Tax=Treponema socranskii TaxID=53419 RepID=UPI0020A3C75B|nr:hypothetical protein [Treponema socranskii]UTD03173.1 hypothetical protein HRI97_08930 [Treponema socranskii subsp. buccale]
MLSFEGAVRKDSFRQIGDTVSTMIEVVYKVSILSTIIEIVLILSIVSTIIEVCKIG